MGGGVSSGKTRTSHVKRQVKRAQDETQTGWRGSSAATHLDCTGAQRGVAAAKLFWTDGHPKGRLDETRRDYLPAIV